MRALGRGASAKRDVRPSEQSESKTLMKRYIVTLVAGIVAFDVEVRARGEKQAAKAAVKKANQSAPEIGRADSFFPVPGDFVSIRMSSPKFTLESVEDVFEKS